MVNIESVADLTYYNRYLNNIQGQSQSSAVILIPKIVTVEHLKELEYYRRYLNQ